MKIFPKDFDMFVASLFIKYEGNFIVNYDYFDKISEEMSYPTNCVIVHEFASVQEFRHYYAEKMAGNTIRFLAADTDPMDPKKHYSYFHIFLDQILFNKSIISQYNFPTQYLQNYAELNNLHYDIIAIKNNQNIENNMTLNRFDLLDI